MQTKLKTHYHEGTLFSVAVNYLKKPFRKLKDNYQVFKIDAINKIKYGKNAPKYYERLWINPLDIEYIIDREEVKRVTGIKREKASAVVIDWNKIENYTPLMDEFRMQYCYKHWVEGISWEDLGIYEFMSNTKEYGGWPLQKIKNRFQQLDEVFRETKLSDRLKTREELDPSNFREKDGILIHIGRNGAPYFGGNGFHRLAIARILKLEKIPVCVGMVAKNSIDKLDGYRAP